MTLNIELLGPLHVTVDGAPVWLTAPKPRRVLVLLSVCANQVVRNEQIIDELWEVHPPVSVATTLQTYVYQLRKCLQLAPERPRGQSVDSRHQRDALRTFSGGYMLCLGADALDTLRFERIARRGQLQLEAGAVQNAAHTLREALDMWHGPAMVDINPGPVLRVEVLRLEEIHRSTVEARIDADLQLGRHHEILAELIELAAKQPTHEGLQGRLMLALYRAGRRFNALRAYQQARNALIAELGVEPSAELQRLHQAILGSDPLHGPWPTRSVSSAS